MLFRRMQTISLQPARAAFNAGGMAERLHEGETIYRGIAVSAGVCRGKILVLDKPRDTVPQRTVSDEEIPAEIERLERALVQTRHQVNVVQRQIKDSVGAEQASI